MGHVHATPLDDVPTQQQGGRPPAPKGPQRAEEKARTPQGLNAQTALNELSSSKPSQSTNNFNTNANSRDSDISSSSSYSSIDLSVLINNLLDIDWNKVANTPISNEKSVVNLSSHVLTESQQSLLKKGLNFCPMPGEPDIAELKNDLYKFERNLKWKLHFACQNPSSIPSNTAVAGTSNANPNLITVPQDTKIFENRKFKERSQAQAPSGPPNLDTLFLMAHRDLDAYVPQRTRYHNLSKEENRAIFELKSNPDIVIKKADKGNAVVIQDTIDYVRECESQLNDDKIYERLLQDKTEYFKAEIEKTLKEMRDKKDISEATFFVSQYPQGKDR